MIEKRHDRRRSKLGATAVRILRNKMKGISALCYYKLEQKLANRSQYDVTQMIVPMDVCIESNKINTV
jgi:hypothetical protein